jgi:MoxR-like ATPase
MINTTTQVETVALPGLDYLAIKLRINGTTSWIRVNINDAGEKSLLISGPAMRVSMFMASTAQMVTMFLLANKHKFPGLVAEMPDLVNAYSNNSDKTVKLNALFRFVDALNFYLTEITDGGHSEITKFGIDINNFEPCEIRQVDLEKNLQNSFINPAKLEEFMKADLFDMNAAAAPIQSSGRYVGPLAGKVKRFVERVKHILISGPTATGKTLCVEEVCSNLNAPLTIMKGAEHLEDIDMIGGFAPGIDGKIEMIYGPLARALKIGRAQYELQKLEDEAAVKENRGAKKIPPSVLFIDEINRLQSRFLNIMITAMNVSYATREYMVEIPCNGEVITCPESFFMIIGAQNLGQLHSNTYSTDLALDRRFYGKLNVDYLKRDEELNLLQGKLPDLDTWLADILCKVAYDTRYQMSVACLRAPIDTDTLLKWAEEVYESVALGRNLDAKLLVETAEDIVYGVCLERGTGSEFEASGVKILADNIQEAWKNGIVNRPVPPPKTPRTRKPRTTSATTSATSSVGYSTPSSFTTTTAGTSTP